MSDAFDAVIDYAFGGLDGTDEAEVERRLFEEPAMADAAAWLLGTRDNLRMMARAGPLIPVVTATELAALARTRRVLECRPTDERVVALLANDLEFVAARLPVDLSDVRRLDVDILDAAGHVYFHTHEAPFDPASGEVIVLCQRHVALAAGTIGVRVFDEKGRERGSFRLDSTLP